MGALVRTGWSEDADPLPRLNPPGKGGCSSGGSLPPPASPPRIPPSFPFDLTLWVLIPALSGETFPAIAQLADYCPSGGAITRRVTGAARPPTHRDAGGSRGGMKAPLGQEDAGAARGRSGVEGWGCPRGLCPFPPRCARRVAPSLCRGVPRAAAFAGAAEVRSPSLGRRQGTAERRLRRSTAVLSWAAKPADGGDVGAPRPLCTPSPARTSASIQRACPACSPACRWQEPPWPWRAGGIGQERGLLPAPRPLHPPAGPSSRPGVRAGAALGV